MRDLLPQPNSEMPCASLRALCGDVAAGEADAMTLMQVDAHVTGCADCRLALASERAYRRAMRRASGSERASDALRDRVFDLHREVRESTLP